MQTPNICLAFIEWGLYYSCSRIFQLIGIFDQIFVQWFRVEFTNLRTNQWDVHLIRYIGHIQTVWLIFTNCIREAETSLTVAVTHKEIILYGLSYWGQHEASDGQQISVCEISKLCMAIMQIFEFNAHA